MTAIRSIFRPATRLAAAAVALLAGLLAAPAAFASDAPPPGLGDTGTTVAPAVVHTVTVGGTPGWQIALFIVAAAALAAVVAVLLDRARSTRRQQLAPSAR
jgi:ABC-type sugar transport system substrate-binding protein